MHVLIPALHRPINPTGVCRHAANLAQCLADTNHVNRVTLLLGKWQKAYFKQSFNIESPKIQLFTINIKNSSFSRNQWFIFGLPKIAQQLQPDIIHLSFPFPFVSQWFKVPVVSTIHDLYPYEYPENFGYPQVWFNRWFLKQCVNSSVGLSCVSKCTLDSLKHYFPDIEMQKLISVIYNYVDLNRVTLQVPNKLASEESPSFLLCVAQHRKNKNLDLLIQSYALLIEDGRLQSSTKLILVGSSGPETEKILTLVQTLSLQEQVILLSSVNDQELCWLYTNCELFIIPSSMEGFCLPLVEALTLSQKVICSDIPIFREVGSSNCRYFNLDKNSIKNLSEVIATTFTKPAFKKISANSRFSKGKVTKQLLKFYASII